MTGKQRVEIGGEPVDFGGLILDDVDVVGGGGAPRDRQVVVVGDEVERGGRIRGVIAFEEGQEPIGDLVVGDDRDSVAGGRGGAAPPGLGAPRGGAGWDEKGGGRCGGSYFGLSPRPPAPGRARRGPL